MIFSKFFINVNAYQFNLIDLIMIISSIWINLLMVSLIFPRSMFTININMNEWIYIINIYDGWWKLFLNVYDVTGPRRVDAFPMPALICISVHTFRSSGKKHRNYKKKKNLKFFYLFIFYRNYKKIKKKMLIDIKDNSFRCMQIQWIINIIKKFKKLKL